METGERETKQKRLSRTHIESHSQSHSHSHSQDGQNVAPFSHRVGYSCHNRPRETERQKHSETDEQTDKRADKQTDRQAARKEAQQNMLVTLHFDALNACCASKLIAAACCSAPKFNAKFNKYNNGAPEEDRVHAPCPNLSPSSPRTSPKK